MLNREHFLSLAARRHPRTPLAAGPFFCFDRPRAAGSPGRLQRKPDHGGEADDERNDAKPKQTAVALSRLRCDRTNRLPSPPPQARGEATRATGSVRLGFNSSRSNSRRSGGFRGLAVAAREILRPDAGLPGPAQISTARPSSRDAAAMQAGSQSAALIENPGLKIPGIKNPE
jgi:hypothetical protein